MGAARDVTAAVVGRKVLPSGLFFSGDGVMEGWIWLCAWLVALYILFDGE